MTTVSEWIEIDARRQAPEFDFGTSWTREHDPHTEWAVTYNTGTGELYARSHNGDDIEVLGHFADPEDVAAALPDWGRRSMQAGSLDWARREALAVRQPTTEVDEPIYGIIIDVDGSSAALREPQSPGLIAIALDTGDLDSARINTGDRTDRVVMWVDDRSNDHVLPVNPTATQLYGTGWPILGSAVVVCDARRPLPPTIVRHLLPNLDDPELASGLDPEPIALDWEDHHRDRDTWDVYDFPDDDLTLMAEPSAEDLEFGNDLPTGSEDIAPESWEPDIDDDPDFEL